MNEPIDAARLDTGLQPPREPHRRGIWIGVAAGGAAVLLAGGILSGSAIAATASGTTGAASVSSGAPVDAALSDASVPQSLRDDLQKLKAAAPADRPAIWAGIKQTALSGGYGQQIQTFAQNVAAQWANAPAALKSDVQALRSAAPADRAAQAQAIRQKALSGGYGAEVQQRAETIRQFLVRHGIGDLLRGGASGLSAPSGS
jgi:hypothetical protein